MKSVKNSELLDKIVADGIKRLLNEVKLQNYLEEPYGKLPYPTPLITEEEFKKIGGLECDNQEPDFVFDYGFDPLSYLGNFIKWSHPDSVQCRRREKEGAVQYLVSRKNHSLLQLSTSQSLSDLAEQLDSGILWGPFTCPISSTSISCICKPMGTGNVIIQISSEADFQKVTHSIEKHVSSVEFTPDDQHQLEQNLSTQVLIDGLNPGKKYFVRCCLQRDLPTDNLSEGFESFKFQSAEFWTIPSEEVSGPIIADDQEDSTLVSNNEFELAGNEASVKHTLNINDIGSTVSSQDSSDIVYPPVSLLCVGQLPLKELHSYSRKRSFDKNKVSPTRSELINETKDFSQDEAACCAVGCILGNLFSSNTTFGKQSATVQIDNLYTRSKLFRSRSAKNKSKKPCGLLRNCSLLLAWRDDSLNSVSFLKREEKINRVFHHDIKKYQKKYLSFGSNHSSKKSGLKRGGVAADSKHQAALQLPALPVLFRPDPMPNLKGLIEGFPSSSFNEFQSLSSNCSPIEEQQVVTTEVKNIETNAGVTHSTASSAVHTVASAKQAIDAVSNQKPCRMLYRTVMCGPDVQLFVLDCRGERGYLGKDQSVWLSSMLEQSTALWKIILVGHSFGVIATKNTTSVSSINQTSNNHTAISSEAETSLSYQHLEEDRLLSTAHTGGSAVASKQVQLNLPSEETRISQLDPSEVSTMYEIVEHRQGTMTKDTLPYVLSKVYETSKQKHSGDVTRDDNMVMDNDLPSSVRLTSGIIVISGGSCSLYSTVEAAPVITDPIISNDTCENVEDGGTGVVSDMITAECTPQSQSSASPLEATSKATGIIPADVCVSTINVPAFVAVYNSLNRHTVDTPSSPFWQQNNSAATCQATAIAAVFKQSQYMAEVNLGPPVITSPSKQNFGYQYVHGLDAVSVFNAQDAHNGNTLCTGISYSEHGRDINQIATANDKTRNELSLATSLAQEDSSDIPESLLVGSGNTFSSSKIRLMSDGALRIRIYAHDEVNNNDSPVELPSYDIATEERVEDEGVLLYECRFRTNPVSFEK